MMGSGIIIKRKYSVCVTSLYSAESRNNTVKRKNVLVVLVCVTILINHGPLRRSLSEL